MINIQPEMRMAYNDIMINDRSVVQPAFYYL